MTLPLLLQVLYYTYFRIKTLDMLGKILKEQNTKALFKVGNRVTQLLIDIANSS